MYWGGGNGGQGAQTCDSVDVTAPEYDDADPATPSDKATAWIKDGSGTARVTRSYCGTLTPLEQRVGEHRGVGKALKTGADPHVPHTTAEPLALTIAD